MNRLDHPLYQEDLETVAASGIEWSALENSTVAISGATGMVGAFLVDLLMYMRFQGLNVSVLALGRNSAWARVRLPYFDDAGFAFEEIDVSVPGSRPSIPADVVVHLASSTHPRAYATQPIGTITSNVTGLQNLLSYVSDCAGDNARFVFASSVEVYGENRGDTERFDESYCGYIDCNTLRAGYPEAKRLGEALCQAYAAERGVRVFIPRLPRLFGPTLLPSDTKALSQFLHRAVAADDIVLKSKGQQEYSYLYTADAVSGLMWVLTRCESGMAFNVADSACEIRLSDLANLIATSSGSRVVYEAPDDVERAGYSTATKALLDGSRLASEGWSASFGLSDGVSRTIEMLHCIW